VQIATSFNCLPAGPETLPKALLRDHDRLGAASRLDYRLGDDPTRELHVAVDKSQERAAGMGGPDIALCAQFWPRLHDEVGDPRREVRARVV
jgi:hypothetical protein